MRQFPGAGLRDDGQVAVGNERERAPGLSTAEASGKARVSGVSACATVRGDTVLPLLRRDSLRWCGWLA